MPSKKKKFINKKNATTYRLVPDTQQSFVPPIPQPPIPQPPMPHPPVPQLPIPQLPMPHPPPSPQQTEQSFLKPGSAEHREEQKKYGITYQDNYDYLKHLKSTDDMSGLDPDAQVFRVYAEQNTEKMKGKLQFRPEAQQDDIDPEILIALEDNFQGEELEDDFMSIADSDQKLPVTEEEMNEASNLLKGFSISY